MGDEHKLKIPAVDWEDCYTEEGQLFCRQRPCAKCGEIVHRPPKEACGVRCDKCKGVA